MLDQVGRNARGKKVRISVWQTTATGVNTSITTPQRTNAFHIQRLSAWLREGIWLE